MTTQVSLEDHKQYSDEKQRNYIFLIIYMFIYIILGSPLPHVFYVSIRQPFCEAGVSLCLGSAVLSTGSTDLPNLA